MERKEELLRNLVNIRFRRLKFFFPMLIDEIDINEIKEDIDYNGSITNEKKKIDDKFKDLIGDYLNTKFNVISQNITFLKTDHELFDFEYDLANKLLCFNNYTIIDDEMSFSELSDDISIKDCKNIIIDFYSELLQDYPDDIKLIKKITNEKVNVVYDQIRSVTNVETKDIDISYSNYFDFLIIFVHEVSHAFALSKTSISFYDQDVRNIETESQFIEKLFIKYLDDKKIPIFKCESGSRPINQDDKDNYFLFCYYHLLEKSFKILNEIDFIRTIDEDNILDREFIDDYLYNSPYEYNYIYQAKIINDVMDNYMKEEEKRLNYYQLKLRTKETDLYLTDDLKSFEEPIRYYLSGILSLYFYDICDDKKQVKKFVEFLRQKGEYSIEEVAILFNIDIDETFIIVTKIFEKYREIVKKKGINVPIPPMAGEEFINEELLSYNTLLERAKTSDDKHQKELIIVKKLFDLLGTNNINLNIYPFDISYQLDDCDVEKYEDYRKQILKLRKK